MRFALLAFTTRMVSGYNRGGVTTHAPSGDGNMSNCAFRVTSGVTTHAPSGDGNRKQMSLLGIQVGYNPRPVRGRKHDFDRRFAAEDGYNPRPVRGRKRFARLLVSLQCVLQPTPRQGTETLIQGWCIRVTKLTTPAPAGGGTVSYPVC